MNEKTEDQRKQKKQKKKRWMKTLAVFLLMALLTVTVGLSIKALDEYVQILGSKYKVMGTATLAQFEGRYIDHQGIAESLKYKYIHYIVEFDESKAGYDRIEYECSNVKGEEIWEGSRYLVCFDDFEYGLSLYDTNILLIDRIAFIMLIVIIIAMLIFRKEVIYFISFEE